METMYDVIDRLRLRYNLRQTDIAHLIRDEDGKPLSRNIMGTWAGRGTMSRSLPLIGDSLFWSTDYLSGHSRTMWRDDVLQAQEQLRNWARSNDFTHMTVAERFVAVWEKWQELLPMREEVWAVFTYMDETITGDVDNPISITQWYACKQNEYQPGRVQIEGAASLTGLPVRWWYTGNNIYLNKFTEAEIERLQHIILEQGFDIDDVEGLINSMKVD